jgi:uncharacterized membrane protein
MAGIGFVLKRMLKRDDLIGVASAYMHSSLISCGPWVFTIIALFIVYTFCGGSIQSEGYLNLQAVLFYNFAYSLIFTAPLHMVATRYIADSIYKQDITDISASLLTCLALIGATQILPVAYAYFAFVELPMLFRLAAFLCFFLLSFIWVLNVYLTALKNYAATTKAFAIGMFIVFIFSVWFLRDYNETGVLIGFDLGLAFIVFALAAEVLAEYNYKVTLPKQFHGYFQRYWELALAGTFYSLGVWGDKLVMAFAPEATVLTSHLRVYFEYNISFFVAYIVMIPSIAMFILSVETHFFEHYRKFYKDILDGVPYSRIESNHQAIIHSIRENGRNLAIMQGCICFFVIVFAPRIFDFLHLAMGQIAMFHFAVLGSYFHVLGLFALIVLAYFECRRAALWIQLVFFVSNVVFTYISMHAGFVYYGYGYFLSSLLTFFLACLCLRHYARQLPYCEFILNNILHKRPTD